MQLQLLQLCNCSHCHDANCIYHNHCNCNHCNDCSPFNSCNHCNHCNHCSHFSHCNCNCCNCNCCNCCNCNPAARTCRKLSLAFPLSVDTCVNAWDT